MQPGSPGAAAYHYKEDIAMEGARERIMFPKQRGIANDCQL